MNKHKKRSKMPSQQQWETYLSACEQWLLDLKAWVEMTPEQRASGPGSNPPTPPPPPPPH